MLTGNFNFKNLLIKKKYFYVLFTNLFLILFVLVAEYFFSYNINQNWEKIINERDKDFEQEVKSKILKYQEELIDNYNQIQKKISVHNTQKDLFEVFDAVKNKNISVNLYNSDGKLIAWKKPLTLFNNDRFKSSRYFFISSSNIYKFLNYSSPVIIDDSTIVYLILSSLLDYNFPISNRFISIDPNQKIFTRELKRNIYFIENLINNIDRKAKFVEIPSLSSNNSKLGFVQYYPLTKDDLIDETEFYFKLIKVFLLLSLGVILSIMFYEIITMNIVSPLKEFIFIIGLWIFRYFILFLGFPSEFFNGSIFNPLYFASDFGYGIAKSGGELLITSITLFISVINLSTIFHNFKKIKLFSSNSSILKTIIVVILLTIVLFLLRGYIAIIISAVRDSNLNYFQQTEIIPSFEKIVMFVNLILITISCVVLSLHLIKLSYQLLKRNQNQILIWIKLSLISIFVVLLYGIHPNPLANLSERLGITFGFLILSYFLKDFKSIFENTKYSFILILTSVILLSFLLNSKINQARENKLIDIAKQMSQPFDDWMAFIVDEALNQMVSSNFIQANNIAEKDLAFNLWAKSILSQKGYDCKLMIVDTNLRVISKFGIGSLVNDTIKLESLTAKRVVKVQEISLSKGGLKYYSGYTPIYDNSQRIIGAIYLDVATSRSELLEPNYSNILLLDKYERDYFFYRTFYNEFKDGYLIYSTNPEFPITYKIQEEVLENIDWINQKFSVKDEFINNKFYKTVYVKPDYNDLIISVNVEIPGWKKFEILRLFIYLITISVLFYFLILFKEFKSIYQISFFTKLLLTFIIVSIIPLLIYSYYSNIYTEERMLSIIKNNLVNETELITKYLETYESVSLNEIVSKITDEFCEEISKKTGIDFFFYSNATCTGSSLPELLQAELISKVMSEGAYRNIILEGRRFFSELQNIGSLNYYAGYRPLMDFSGNITGVISVLTLSKIGFLEEEIAGKNIYMFAIYFIVLILVFGAGILLSKQITLPLKKLVDYTKIVADGNLEVKIKSHRQDEIGKLENAFDKMTAELKQKRDELIKYEKEIAWKEMAKQVAHEIKNPLTPIKLSIQQVYRAYKDGAKNFGEIFQQAYEMISEQIETLNRIASEFSNFARMPARKLELCSVNELIDEAIQLFIQYQGISFIKNYCDQNLQVIADKDELRRAFINIIRNSVQAIGNKGRIEVITEKQNDQITISISDNGPGIPDEIAERIFEPNFSTKSDGMGLGLAIVKRTIEDLNGEISFSTKVGEGTKFIIKLKIIESESNSNNKI